MPKRVTDDGVSAREVRRGRGVSETGATTVPAAARTVAVFEIFARERRELTKSEVARLLDLPESSTSDLLNTLHEIGYLSRTASTRRFYPTGRLLAMASAIAENDPLTAFGTEATGLLAQRSGETACCAVLAAEQIKVVAVSEGSYRLRYVLNVGDTFTVHATAIGKALLGGLGDDDMRRVLRLRSLPRRTDNSKTDPREVEAEVREHRKLGWFQAIDEGTMGVSSFAVSGHVGDRLVGLGIIGPTDRVRSRPDEMRNIVVAVGQQVFDRD